MASMTPAMDRPRPAPKSRFWTRVFSALSVSAVVLAPVAAMTLWLLISDPVTAAAVMERTHDVSWRELEGLEGFFPIRLVRFYAP